MTRSRRLPFRFSVVSNRPSGDVALGGVWQGNGFVYDLLITAACS